MMAMARNDGEVIQNVKIVLVLGFSMMRNESRRKKRIANHKKLVEMIRRARMYYFIIIVCIIVAHTAARTMPKYWPIVFCFLQNFPSARVSIRQQHTI